MRFHRSDWPGILIAGLAPPALMLLFLASYDTWNHHGTPLLGTMSANLAVGGALIAAFTRFIKKWDIPLASLIVILASAASVLALQHYHHDNAVADLLKWFAVIGFLVFNVAAVLQMLNYGLIPALNQRAARKAAESES